VIRPVACIRVLLALTSSAMCASPTPGRADLGPGDYTVPLDYQGRHRSYIVHVPPSGSSTARAVVLNFHGGGGYAANQQSYSRMDPTADREGFLAVYPNGTGRLPTRLLTWNAGTCCGYAADHNVDDVGFTRAVIEDLSKRTPVNRSRIYATGLSNGAMLAYRLALEASDLIAAIAPVAGSEVAPFRPVRPMSILHIHSVDDPRALYAGGLGPPFPFTDVRIQHPAVEEVISRWVDYDGCPRLPQIDPPRRGSGKSGRHTATRIAYAPCKDGSEIVLWKLTGAGHVWPGGKLDYLPRLLGPGTDVIDANVEMWRFFARFRRSP